GGTSTAQNPSHTYRGPGTYTVSLTVTPEYNCDSFVPLDALWDGDRIRPANARYTETKELYIIVTEPAKEYEEYQEAEPASMNTCYMTVSATQVLPGQEVIITSNVCNNGGEKGSHTAILRINGNQEQSQSVGVSPGACKTVIFKVAKSYPGTYQVSVDGQQGQFTVLAPVIKTTTVATPAQGITTTGIIVIVIVGVILVIAIVFIVRTTKQP
ncbi:MAG: PKD domain-containing protein, partial [Dehalococcoidia bacterium]|nr:PKD domain-containing protein [Dehalococcoidia bacterium]